jgi:hypothetical protein
MASHLKGKKQMEARFRAIVTDVSRPAAERWQNNATKIARSRVPNRGARSKGYSTGKLHDSISAQALQVVGGRVIRGKVVMRYTGYFVDAGTQGHGTSSRVNRSISRRGLSGAQAEALFARRTVFTKKARNRRGGGYAARPFREYAAKEAMRRISLAQGLIDAWNSAA